MRIFFRIHIFLSLLFFVISPRVFSMDKPEIPEKYAVIQDSYTGESEYEIYYIQDAHCNLEAQKNIYNIINELIEKAGVELITMEGAQGEISPDDLRAFPYDEAKKLVSNYFLKKGRINGVEYYAINSPDPVKVMGIENRDLYQANHNFLLSVYGDGDQGGFIDSLRDKIDGLKKKFYSEKLNKLDALESSFEEDLITMQEYFLKVVDLAQKAECFKADDYVHLVLCVEMIRIEKTLSLEEIEKQRAKLAAVLTAKMTKDEVSAFLQESLRFRLNKVSYKGYLNYLTNLIDEYNVSRDSFEQLYRYKRYLGLHDSVRQTEIFSELDDLRDKIFISLSDNEEQQIVRDISIQISLLAKAFDLKISFSEWDDLSDKSFLTDESLLAFLRKQHVDIFSDEETRQKIMKHFTNVCSFYEIADKRDDVLVENMLKTMKRMNIKKAVIVAGGYHSHGIVNRLRDKGISYHSLRTKVSNDSGNNLYASISAGKLSRLEKYFNGDLDTLAVSSWLEENPLNTAVNRNVFNYMFKSLLISTLAWQLTGYDIASVKELNLPILRGVKDKLSEVLSNVDYDIEIIELSRVEDQVFIRLSVAGREVVYGLFSERDTVDLSAIDGKKIDGSKALTEFSYLGGKIVAVTPVQYEGVLNAAAQRYTTSDAPTAVVVRSMLMNPRSTAIIKPLVVKGLNGKTESEVSSAIDNIMIVLGHEKIIEDRKSVESYVKTMIDDFLETGRLTFDGADNVFSFEERSLFAASIAMKAMGNSEGLMAKISVPLNIKNGQVGFIFVNDAVPFIVLERLHELMDEHISVGTHDLIKIGEEAFIVDIFAMGKSFFASVSTDSGFPELQTLDGVYSDLIGRQTVNIVIDEGVELNVSSITETQSGIYFVKRDSTGKVIDTVGPSVPFTRGSNSSLDKAVNALYQWNAKGLVNVKAGSFAKLDESITGLLKVLLVSDVSGLDKASQLESFRNLLHSFKYVSERDMPKTAKILSGKITEIIRGANPKFIALTGSLKSQKTVFNKAEISTIYNAYIHHIDFNQANIDSNVLESVILEKLLEEVYVEENSVSPGSAQEKLLVALKGGKYPSKLDLSAVDKTIERKSILKIFSDADALDETFKKAGLSFVNTKKIIVVRSRVSGMLKDYKVIVEEYDGTKNIIRLRSIEIPHIGRAFLENIKLMTTESAKASGLFPEIYYYSYGSERESNFCFVEHVEGIMADRIRNHPEEFSKEDTEFVLFQAIQAWLRVWDVNKVTDEAETQNGTEYSNAITPVSLTGVIIPKDGSDPVILGTGTVIPSTPYNFYQYISILPIGMELDREQFSRLFVNSMISVFGFERSMKLIIDAAAFAQENDVEFLGYLLKVMKNIKGIRSLMQYGMSKKLVDIVYDGDAVAAYKDVSSTCIKNNLSLTDVLLGYHHKWSKKMPSVKEAKSDLRRKKPSIITISGGTGGSALINSIKGLEGESVVGLVTTFDSGGWQSYWQNIMFPHVGYVPGQSDKANVLVAHCDDAIQDLLNKRLPDDVDLSDMDYVIQQLITPTLEAYPELKESPGFLIDFMGVMKNVYELVDVLNKKHLENPVKYKKPDLASSSLKTLFVEGVNYFAGAYDFKNGKVDKEKLILANYLVHKLLRIDKGLVLPMSMDEGDLVARMKMTLAGEDGTLGGYMNTQVGLSHKRGMLSRDALSVYGEDFIGEIGKIVSDFGGKVEYLDVVKGEEEEHKPKMALLADDAMHYPGAEIIVVAPGSLFTSSLANFTLEKFVEDLVSRGQRNVIVYPNGSKVVIEPAKRIFIVNPIYTPEDSGMSVTDMIKMAEATAQKATDNPNLRFEDMFDAVVVNDPTKSDKHIRDYIRENEIKVILPEGQDLHFLARKGIEVHSFDMCNLQKRFTREPGFTLKYETKLGYSDEKLQLVAGLFLNSTRAQREKEGIRVNVGSGLSNTKSKYKVYDRIRKGNIFAMNSDSLFLQKGLDFLDQKIADFKDKIGAETVPSKKQKMEKDLSMVEQVVQHIRSGDMRLFRILPEDGSKSILTEDLTNYQFATVVPGDERSIKNGIYISQGLIDVVTDYLDESDLLYKSGDDQKRADYLRDKVASIAGETLFTLFSKIALMSDPKGLSGVEDDIKEIINSHISSGRSDYGSYLDEEMLKMVRHEIAERDISYSSKFMSFPEGSSLPEKVYLLKEKLSSMKKLENDVNDLVSITEDIKQKWRSNLSPLISGDLGILDQENVKNALKEFNFLSFEDAVLFCAKDLQKISVSFNKDLTQNAVLLWLRKVVELEQMLKPVQDNINVFIPSVDQRSTFYDVKDDIFLLDVSVKILIGKLNDLKDNFSSLQEMLSSHVTVVDMQEAIRQLNLEYVYQKQPKLKSTVPDIMETTSILKTMKGVELESWFDEQINSKLGTSRASFLSNYDHFSTTLDKIMEGFPFLEEMIQGGTPPIDVQSPEHTVFNAVRMLRKMAVNKNLNGYAEIFRLGQDLNHYYVNQLFDSFVALAPREEKEIFTLIDAGRSFLSKAKDDYKKAERVVSSLQGTYPEPFGNYVEYLIQDGKITNVNRFSTSTKLDSSLYSVIDEGTAVPLESSDVLLKEVKNRLRKRAYKLMVDSRKEDGLKAQKMQVAATFFLSVHSLLKKDAQFSFWSISPKDSNPGILIDGESDHTFYLSIDSDIYISKGLMDRIDYLVQNGKTQRAVDMLSEIVMDRVGTRLLEQEIGFVMDDLGVVKNLIDQYRFYLNDVEPNLSDETKPYTPLQREIIGIVSVFIEQGITDVTQVPMFSYPSDNKVWSASVRAKLMNGELSNHDFLEMMKKHFSPSFSNGAPEAMLHNATYYHPGKAYDVLKANHKKNLEKYTIPHLNRIIQLSKTDPKNRKKAWELCGMFVTHDNYSDFIYGLGIHAMEDILYDIVRVVTGDDNPYMTIKNDYNERGLNALPAMDKMIAEQADPLLGAVMTAIAGNVIDFADSAVRRRLSREPYSFEKDIKEILRPEQQIMINDYADLMKRISQKTNQSIIYCVDNAGELATDLPLLKKLLLLGHKIVLVTRDKNTVNDISYADALSFFVRPDVLDYFVDEKGKPILNRSYGDDGNFEIISSGSNVTGTDLRRVNSEFVNQWVNADIRILKGQGSYETLHDYPIKQDMFFLLKIKNPMATQGKYATGSVLIEHKEPNSLYEIYLSGDLEYVNKFFKSGLNNADKDKVEEFVLFYLEYLSGKLQQWSSVGEEEKMSAKFAEADRMLSKILSIPDLRPGVYKVIQEQLLRKTNLDSFLTNLMRVDVALVNKSDTMSQEQYIVIDFDAIPDGNLAYISEMLKTINKNRKAGDFVDVKLVVFSTEHAKTHIIESLITRKLHLSGIEIIGADEYNEFYQMNKDIHDNVPSVILNYIGVSKSKDISPESVKLITKNDTYAKDSSSENMFVIKLSPVDNFSAITDFISGIISADSLIHGGKVPNLSVVDPKSGLVLDLMNIMVGRNGNILSSELSGKILGVKPSLPRKERLREMEFKRVLDKAI